MHFMQTKRSFHALVASIAASVWRTNALSSLHVAVSIGVKAVALCANQLLVNALSETQSTTIKVTASLPMHPRSLKPK